MAKFRQIWSRCSSDMKAPVRVPNYSLLLGFWSLILQDYDSTGVYSRQISSYYNSTLSCIYNCNLCHGILKFGGVWHVI